jgi:predicted AlkP superfamily phosphohydrolase/phosphomutase
VYPAEFYEVLKSIPGFDPKELSMDVNEELKSIQYLPRHEYERWISRHISREWQWFSIIRYILKNNPTDLMAVVFDGVDKLQHLCWQYLDLELFPSHPAPWEAKIRQMCLDYFRQLDGFIREIVTLAGPDARVFLASDHGFGASREVFYANVWLEREGYLSWSDRLSKDELGRISADRIKSHVVGIDWAKTTAYALTPSSNGIFIRRADGPGQPGITDDEYESFRHRLAEKLFAFRHPATGRPVFKHVMTREEAFPGNESHRAPDLTLVLEDYGFLSVLNADAVIKRRPEPVGTHHPHGVFMAGGAGIAGPRSLDALSIIDVAPTLLHSLNLPIPAHLEGRVVTECYNEDLLNTLPVVYDESTRPSGGTAGLEDSVPWPDDEQESVLNRLRELGYIE